MQSYRNNEKIKSLLKDAVQFVEYQNQLRNLGLSVYLENFVAACLNLYYKEYFVNINKIKTNTPGFDLISSNKTICSVTTEKANKTKVENSISKTKNIDNYKKLIVFFFQLEKSEIDQTIISCPIELEVFTFNDLISKCDTDKEFETNLKKLCELWIEGKQYDFDLFTASATISYEKINANKRSKKYIPEIYIDHDKLKDACRHFCDDSFFDKWLWFELEATRDSFGVEALKSHGYFEQIDYFQYFKDTTICHDDLPAIKEKMKAAEQFYENLNSNNLKTKEPLARSQAHYEGNSSYKFHLYHLRDDIENQRKKFYIILKEAGQGKTNFLCDFCDTFLSSHQIPFIYINVSDTSDNILGLLESRLEEITKQKLTTALAFLDDYCGIVQKKLIILIDGLNECSNPRFLYNNFNELARRINGTENIKVILTSRNHFYETYFNDIANQDYFPNVRIFVEQDHRARRGSKTNSIFEKRLLDAYIKYFNVTLNITPKAKVKLQKDTLLLRIFCEVYENKTVNVNDIYLYRLFQKYIDKRQTELFKAGKLSYKNEYYELLIHIAKELLIKKVFANIHELNLSDKQKQLLDLVVDEDILIREEKSFGPGPLQSSYTFTYDEFRDYLLSLVVSKYAETEYIAFAEEMDMRKMDGIMRYLFIYAYEFKEKKDLLKKINNFSNIYFNNVFFIEDSLLDDSDVNLISKTLESLIAKEDDRSLSSVRFIIYCLLML